MQSDPVSPPPITTTCLPAAENRLVRADRLAGHAPVLLRQEVHREVNAGKIAAGRRQVARRLGAAGERDCVVAVEDRLRADRIADVSVIVEDDAFGLHLLDAAVDVALLQLEVRDAIAQQAARLRRASRRRGHRGRRARAAGRKRDPTGPIR